jgi:hypothetical protein
MIFGTYAITPSGRVRHGVFFVRAFAGIWLDLADDVLKAATYECVRRGYELAGCHGEEFAILVKDDPSPPIADGDETSPILLAHVQAIQEAVLPTIRKYLRSYPCPITVTITREW